DPLLEPICGFTAGPHYYLEAGSVRQGLRVELLSAGAPTGAGGGVGVGINQQAQKLPGGKLEKEHKKVNHVLGLREDLSEFFHIHPVRTGPGMWEATQTFARGGKYKLWSEVKYLGTSYSFGQQWLTVTGEDIGGRKQPCEAGTDCVAVAGCRLNLE